ncbi:MAG: sigma-70 family RNA polymerase sigma factor [bacterium]
MNKETGPGPNMQEIITNETNPRQAVFAYIKSLLANDRRFDILNKQQVITAEDILTETIITADQIRHKRRNQDENVTSWLCGIAVNKMRNLAVKEMGIHRKNLNFQNTQIVTGQEKQKNALPDLFLQKKLEQAWRELSGKQKLTLGLKMQGFTEGEISSILKLHVGTVRSRVNSARQNMADSLHKQGIDINEMSGLKIKRKKIDDE